MIPVTPHLKPWQIRFAVALAFRLYREHRPRQPHARNAGVRGRAYAPPTSTACNGSGLVGVDTYSSSHKEA